MNSLIRYPASVPNLHSVFEDDFFVPSDVLLDRVLSKTFPEFTNVFGSNVFESGAYPKVDVRETDTEFVIEAEIPGLMKDQVKVEVKDNVLVMRGEKRDETKKDGTYHVKEIKRSSFIRSWTLPPDIVDKNTVKAKFQDGVLEVKVGKIKAIPPPKPSVKQIDIE